MRIPFLHRTHRGNDQFPRLRDLLRDAPHLTVADAERALDGLHRMISIDIARVYHAHLDNLHWQVWLDVTQRRLTLAEWADEWLRKHPRPVIRETEGA